MTCDVGRIVFRKNEQGVGNGKRGSGSRGAGCCRRTVAEGRLPFPLTAFKVERDQSDVYRRDLL
jgi:hypothetical protein